MKFIVITQIRMRLLAAFLLLPGCAMAQIPTPLVGEAQFPKTSQSGKELAPIDITGYWVSLITEDWRYRMMTPPKGDYNGVPLNSEGKRVADQWDPLKDEAAGEQCKAYAAPAIMRVAGRLHITWQDDNTLKIDIDNGQQTRLLHFGDWKAPAGQTTWQGQSVADWQWPGKGRVLEARGALGLQSAGAAGSLPPFANAARPSNEKPSTGSLTVITTKLRPGYLRKNGVPFSANAMLTEYFDLSKEKNGDQWLTVTTIVDDPQFLEVPFITSSHFRKEPDGSKWMPEECSAR
jgi:hypothetical protein